MTKVFILLLLCFANPITQKVDRAGKLQTKNELGTGIYYISEKENDYPRQHIGSDERFYIDPNPIVPLKHFSKIEIQDDDARMPMFIFHLDSIGKKEFDIATAKSINKKLAFIIDDKLVFTPMIVAPIPGGVITLRGVFTKAELEELERKMKAEM